MNAGAKKLMTISDAVEYIESVRARFKDKMDKYLEFSEVIKAYKAGRTDPAGVIARMKDLFKGHSDLISGFNNFLPMGYEITLPLEDEQPPSNKPIELKDAVNFVLKIKTRFQNDDHVYKLFLGILSKYNNKNMSIVEAYQKVTALFRDHPDLIDGFRYFLPRGHPDLIDGFHHFLPNTSIVREMPTEKRERTLVSNGDSDPIVDCPGPNLDRGVLREENRESTSMEKLKGDREGRDEIEGKMDDTNYASNGGRDSFQEKEFSPNKKNIIG